VIVTGDGPLLVALGSGSTPRRESIALVSGLDTPGAVALTVAVPRFYAGLRASVLFAGSELNVEGAIHLDGSLRLFGRGNGATLGDVRPVNATCEIAWAALRAHVEAPDRVPPPMPSRCRAVRARHHRQIGAVVHGRHRWMGIRRRHAAGAVLRCRRGVA
jgi:hypothetical protein